jgi:hypothetical protein
VLRSGEIQAWGYGGDGALASGKKGGKNRTTGPCAVGAFQDLQVEALSGSSGFVAIATAKERQRPVGGSKEDLGFYTWGRTSIYVEDMDPSSREVLIKPHRFEVPGLFRAAASSPPPPPSPSSDH